LKFLIDMPLSPALVNRLGERGHDAVHASTVGLDRSPDAAVLQRASDEDRVLVTADLDYGRLLFLARAHASGLIFFRGGQYSEREITEILHRVLESVPETELVHSLVVADRSRIRKRRLPIKS
jgi:predicted nuclease of predicted toxin-antitoxin system